MKELANISVYPFDTEPFEGGWEAILEFHRSLGLDGLEVLTAFDGTGDVPPYAVEAVHLPFWMDWMPLWLGRDCCVEAFSPNEMRYFRGGCSRGELVDNMIGYLADGASLDPAYAVFHLCNTSIGEVLTGRQENGSRAVLLAAAQLLNEAVASFPGGEPPMRLFFENLWWEGLTFLDADDADFFASSLSFSNWAFLVDTGHLLNTTTLCRDEEEAADYIVDVIRRLPGYLRDRIEGVHLSLSLTGRLRSAPDWHETAPVSDLKQRLDRAWQKMVLTDEHRPFETSACCRIIEVLEPEYLTHEFICRSPGERREKIMTQRKALGREGRL